MTLSAVIHNPGPMLATKASRTKPGSKRICQPGANWYHTIITSRIDEADQEIDERHDHRRRRHDQPRKIHLADQVGIADQAVRRLAQAAREEGPGQHPREHHQRVRGVAVGGQLGDAAEDDGKDHHRQNRPDHRPGRADDRLLVAHRDIAPRQDVEQLAIAPQVAPVIALLEASLYDDHVRHQDIFLREAGTITRWDLPEQAFRRGYASVDRLPKGETGVCHPGDRDRRPVTAV